MQQLNLFTINITHTKKLHSPSHCIVGVGAGCCWSPPTCCNHSEKTCVTQRRSPTVKIRHKRHKWLFFSLISYQSPHWHLKLWAKANQHVESCFLLQIKKINHKAGVRMNCGVWKKVDMTVKGQGFLDSQLHLKWCTSVGVARLSFSFCSRASF